MRLSPRLLAGALAGGLLLTACGDDDATREGLIRSLTEFDAGVTTEQAQCIADELYGRFDEEQIEQIAGAGDRAELPEGAERAIVEAYEGCVQGAG